MYVCLAVIGWFVKRSHRTYCAGPTLATAVLSKIVGCEAKVSSLSGRAAELYKQLETIDPVHAKFYQYAAKHDRAALTFGM